MLQTSDSVKLILGFLRDGFCLSSKFKSLAPPSDESDEPSSSSAPPSDSRIICLWSVKGRTRWYVGGGGCGFFPVQTFFFAPNQKQTFFPSQGKEQAILSPHITPFLCQFCEQTFYLLQFTEQTIFPSLFAEQSFVFSKNHSPLYTYHLVGP